MIVKYIIHPVSYFLQKRKFLTLRILDTIGIYISANMSKKTVLIHAFNILGIKVEIILEAKYFTSKNIFVYRSFRIYYDLHIYFYYYYFAAMDDKYSSV